MKVLKQVGLWLGRKLVHACYVPDGTEQSLSFELSQETVDRLRGITQCEGPVEVIWNAQGRPNEG